MHKHDYETNVAFFEFFLGLHFIYTILYPWAAGFAVYGIALTVSSHSNRYLIIISWDEYVQLTICSLRLYSTSKRNTPALFGTTLDLSSSPDTINLQCSCNYEHETLRRYPTSQDATSVPSTISIFELEPHFVPNYTPGKFSVCVSIDATLSR